MVLGIRFLHILSAAIFFGGLIPVHFLYPVAVRLGDRAARLGALRVVVTASRLFLSPGSILLFLTGFGLSGVLHVSMRQPWLVASVALYLLAAISTMAVMPRHGRALLAAAEEAVLNPDGPDPVQALTAQALPRVVRLVSFYSAIIILALMVMHTRT